MSVRLMILNYRRISRLTPNNVKAWFLLIVASANIIVTTADKILSINHVRHFEPVYYDHVALHNQHHVTKRSTETQLEFQFEAFDIHFKTRLKRDTSSLHPNIVIETSHEQVPYDITRVYSGSISGYPSRVRGIITSSGHFEGRIQVDNETYFLERSQHHFKEPRDFHSIIYRQSDVTFKPSDTTCGVQRLYETQKHFSTNGLNNDVGQSKTKSEDATERDLEDGSDVYQNKYSQEVNSKHRYKRGVDPAKVTCELYMQADHLYYEKYYSNVDTVIEKLTQHVQAINNIFPAVDFDGNSSPDNVNFVIKKIKVHTDPTVQGYKYNGNIGVETLLDLHSSENYDDFCLSYLFTNRDFDGGILGLAWVGDTSDAGGVCERNGAFQGQEKSLNTGLVSIINYNKEVPSAVSHVTFAHEVGHNFGSQCGFKSFFKYCNTYMSHVTRKSVFGVCDQHDPDGNVDCSPGGDSGNYIMYAYATSGDQANNDHFSTCSIGSIGPVLEVKARGNDGCFVANTNAICGNRITEGDEECDCGWVSECTEGCCNPQTDTPGAETPCTRKSTAACSPSEGACCNDSCQFRLLADNYSCRPATSCQEEAFCDGANFNATCPPSDPKPNATSCGDSQDFLVCYKGECSGSVCLAHGRVPCYCSPTTPGDTKDEKLCQLCCKDDSGDCKSSYELDDVPDASVVAGTPCNNYGGYCDVYKKCRSVSPEGPLNNLKKLFLDGELVNTVKEFLTKHWYVGLAAGLGFVIIIGLVVKFCRKTYKPVDLPETSPGTAGRNRVQPERF